MNHNAAGGDPADYSSSPAAGRFTEEWGASRRGSSLLDIAQHNTKSSPPSNLQTVGAPNQNTTDMQRTASTHSFNAGDDQSLPTKESGTIADNANGVATSGEQRPPSRGNTLKKKSSMRRGGGSVRRSSSRRSMRAGSVRSLAMQSTSDPDEAHSVFFCPIPTDANPTDVLANRFQSWRKVLKDLIAYFREIQSHYESKSKSLVKLSNTSNNISTPPGFLTTAGIDDALQFLRNYNKNAIAEANKAKEIEEDVILALTGLRSDLQQKIKEIKNLSGDFKNSVNKEMDATAKAVRHLQDALGKTEVDEATTTGRQDPFLLRLAVDRQVERQMDEENYLHQAFLNLESSGRELESIVVGEIQKAYNAYAGIMKREADNIYNVIGELREGPVTMPKDQEWIHFVTHDNQFIDPTIPLRTAEQVHYPGQQHISAQEIRAGLLERKSKYLKSYTAGWYVLSTTHLHEFKSADKGQAPVMSLYLPEQKLGSHSDQGRSSNKFVLKGRQTGSMHRGHTWVFRAESHDTMMAWYEDIKALTEKSPEERNQFVRNHSRSLSQSSRRSVSSDGMMDDEDDDEEPFSAGSQIDLTPGPRQEARRSQPGGRFPSDIQVNAQRGLQANRSPSSLSSGQGHHLSEQQHPHQQEPPYDSGTTDAEVIAAAGAIPGAGTLSGLPDQDQGFPQDRGQASGYGDTGATQMSDMPSGAYLASKEAQYDGVNPYTSEPVKDTQAKDHHSGPEEHYSVPPIMVGQQGQQGQRNDEKDAEVRTVPGVSEMSVDNQASGPGAGHRDVNMLAAGTGGFPRSESAAETNTTPSQQRYSEASSLATTTDVSTVDDLKTRPSSNNVRTDSAVTISNLHIPGQYPKGGLSGSTS